MGCPLQIADSRKPSHIMAKSFPVFLLWFLVATGLPLLTESGSWHAATTLFVLYQETYSRYWHSSGKPIPAIRWLAFHYQLFTPGAPWKGISCGELATPLLTVKPVGVYSTTLVQYLYISCYLSDNKPVLSYLLSRLLPQSYIFCLKPLKTIFETIFKRIPSGLTLHWYLSIGTTFDSA